jgi:hypothetical protein
MEGAAMLKKSALSLFGLAVMLICINPPQAHAGVVVAIGPVYPRPVYVRPYSYVAPPYIAYAPGPYAYGPVFVRPSFGYPGYYRPNYYRSGYWGPRRFEHREYMVRRPYWRH